MGATMAGCRCAHVTRGDRGVGRLAWEHDADVHPATRTNPASNACASGHRLSSHSGRDLWRSELMSLFALDRPEPPVCYRPTTDGPYPAPCPCPLYLVTGPDCLQSWQRDPPCFSVTLGTGCDRQSSFREPYVTCYEPAARSLNPVDKGSVIICSFLSDGADDFL